MQGFLTELVTIDAEYNLNSVITLYVRHGNAAFRIYYDPQILAVSPPVLEQHHEAYNIMHGDDPGGEYLELVKRLRGPFEELMTQMAPNLMESTRYLHRYLYPPWFILEARVGEGSSHIQPHFKETVSRQALRHPGEAVIRFGLKPYLAPLLDSKLKKYSSDQVQILDQTLLWVPSRVLVDNKEYFFKPWVVYRGHTYHDIQSYSKILADSEASQSLLTDTRFCHLHGLIIDNDKEFLQHYPLDSNEEDYSCTRLVGLLLTYIENKGTLRDVAPWSDCTNEDRLRWSMQIQNYVKCLHEAGVVWGDAKPENVLVDMKGDAWLIDFGGSYRPGWVDEDKQETMEGDLQGVQRIDEWLRECSRQPTTRIK
ncbi:hypothetical protein N7466_002108 [Penicillium verhagenii]|uniref:uncharacterized protein n=1 Tax=Penicillium verhagenii TaxID=1562060 RepID=UPI0025453786|nr:uncharacterized protein N7466_002108 [Penicillium verhagenii]KAJ5938974.1 hypothetical protein N7466_002108 [Penicillium verhagenii]